MKSDIPTNNARSAPEATTRTAGLRSMTGFGRGEHTVRNRRIVIELGSVNRKQFDCQISLPREMAGLESTIQTRIRAVVRRGYVKGALRVESAERNGDGDAMRLDTAVARRLIKEIRAAARDLGLADDLRARDLISLPGVFASDTNTLDAAILGPAIETALTDALRAMEAMRQREGRHLARDLTRCTRRLQAQVEAIRRQAPEAVRAWRRTLLKRMHEFRTASPGEETSLNREVALFADRSDIREEITRIASHLDQLGKIIERGGPCGRTLDFLCQELFREINTLGVKANNLSIARRAIRFKSELEALREQVQNIE